MTKHAEEKKGEIYILIKFVLESFVPVAAYYGATRMPQIEFLAIVTLISSLLFVAITFYYKQFHQLFDLKKWPSFFLYTLAVMSAWAIIFYATKYSNALDTSLLLQSEILYAALIGFFLLKEKMPLAKIIGIVCITFSNIAVLFKGQISFSLANFALFTAPFIFVLGNVLAKKLQREGTGWAPLLLFRQLAGGLLLLVFSFSFEDTVMPTANLWFFLIAFAFAGFGIGKMLWQMALHRLDVSKVTAFMGSSTIISAAIAYFWLNEVPNNYQWASIVLTIIGVGFLLQTTSKQWKVIEQ